MVVIIKRNGKVVDRFTESDNTAVAADYAVELVADSAVPLRPQTPAGFGKRWQLDYVSDELAWVAVDRELNMSERMTAVENALIPQWAVGVYYDVGKVLMYEGVKYKVIQAHTSQADWLPNAAPALYAVT